MSDPCVQTKDMFQKIFGELHGFQQGQAEQHDKPVYIALYFDISHFVFADSFTEWKIIVPSEVCATSRVTYVGHYFW